MAWCSYLSTGWEISTLHAILLKPHSGVFAWICSHGGCICSFPKEILEMPDKDPPAECWEMGTLCCCRGRCRIERGGESGGREKGGKEMLHFFSQLFPFALFYLPFPPTSFSSPFLPLPCRLNALLQLWFWPHLSSGDWPTHFCRTSKDQAGTKISNNKLFL